MMQPVLGAASADAPRRYGRMGEFLEVAPLVGICAAGVARGKKSRAPKELRGRCEKSTARGHGAGLPRVKWPRRRPSQAREGNRVRHGRNGGGVRRPAHEGKRVGIRSPAAGRVGRSESPRSASRLGFWRSMMRAPAGERARWTARGGRSAAESISVAPTTERAIAIASSRWARLS